MEFLAPAKINLSLRVLGRRDDGFHDIQTLMAPISIFDTLEMELTENESLQFSCSESALETVENLVVRAVDLFCGELGFQPSVKIHLKKEVPHGAGLGGGSSDAATTLMGLDHLFQTQLPEAELSRMAAQLGSDTPFFIAQTAAWCSGRGENVRPVDLPTSIPLLLLKPPFEVPTPWAYQHWRDSKEIPDVDYGPQKFEWGDLVNDLERPVFPKYLQLAMMKSWLREQAEVAGSLMSGSGSTVFAILQNKESGMALAERALAQFGTNLWVGVTETV